MHGEVRSTEQISPTMVRVVLGGSGLDGLEMPDCTDSYINAAIPPAGATYGPVFDPREVRDTHPQEEWPLRRRYSVRRWDAARREMTLDFVVHGDAGHGGPWADRAEAGDVLVLTRTLTDIYEKQGTSGPLIFVVYAMRVESENGELVMEETRRRIFR